ncbi:hypothetical protein [Anaerolinea sp.]|uniref:hypothetical protein n=1 Tax=Anaerolinea sp. TaxID=1872519 RepID=UPI002ACE347F|nr:hypothetical protein [Anaerolinea sp.]
MVALDGTTYYPTGASLRAVDAQGGLRWRINLPTYSIINSLPRLIRDERFLPVLPGICHQCPNR